MATNNNSELERYKNLQNELQNKLDTSKTANSKPTSADLKTEVDIRGAKQQEEKLKSDYLKSRWYPDKTNDEGRKRDESLLMKGIHTLGMPLYGIVGATETALGKGSVSGIANIWNNIKEHGTFGDLLKTYNVPKAVSAPLGFALDVALDPVMWATAGTAATIPRIVKGIEKAGAKGAAQAVKSGALRKGATLARFTPGVDAGSMVKKAAKASKEYDTLVGRDVDKLLQGNADKIRWGEKTEEFLNKSKYGQALIAGFKYSNKEWFQAAKLEETIGRLKTEAGAKYIVSGDAKTFASDIENVAKNVPEELKGVVNGLREMIDDGASIATKNSKIADDFTHIDMTNALEGEAALDDAFKKIFSGMDDLYKNKLGKADDVEWYNKMVDQFKNIKIGDKEVGYNILKEYDRFIKLFKIAKIGGNISAYTNAVVGNVTMASMAGLNITNPGFFKNVKSAHGLLRGKVDEKFVNMLMQDEGWIHFMDQYPDLFKNAFGTSRAEVAGISKAGQLKRSVVTLEGKGEEALKSTENIENVVKDVGAKTDIVSSISDKWKNITGNKNKLPSSSTFIGEEVYGGGAFGNYFNKWISGLEKKGKEGSTGAKFMHWYLTEPMNAYQRIDGAYRLGTAVHLTKGGITERELLTLSKTLRIDPKKDLTYAAEKGLYYLSPERASEAVLEMYLNYGAMPAAVKVLRSMPFFGAPFASFAYGMAAKTGKTVINNPAVFNKIQFFLEEMAGDKTPLERYALETPYYEWYKKSGMVKLPFFEDNPMYLNVANMVPYYTMNMFQPSERSYEKTLSSGVANVVDKMPIFKTPEGQVLFDYFIQPLILRESQPRGMFDQLLWPTDASNLEKLGYAGRTLSEAVVPPATGPLGLAVPEAALNLMPSFRMRQFGFARKGKTNIGVQGTESGLSRVARTAASSVGLPVYPLKTQYIANDIKKNTK